jgi:asparagine synthase (glutamine-hydrolysing)
MCGIAGQVSYSRRVLVKDISVMIDSLAHRGPDDEGIYISSIDAKKDHSQVPSIGLGHRRLSIIDLSTGHQPVHNEDKTVWIVFNGEIYNFPVLRKNLRAKGHVFYTSTDTEVILHLYEEFGEDCVKHLRGMFSFAIWDENEKKLFAARDRIGKKPLYYFYNKMDFVFASELKGILTLPLLERSVDRNALLKYLQYGYIPDPSSIFKDVYKLPPGHTLSYVGGRVTLKKYWEISFLCSNTNNEEDVQQELLERLIDSVRVRLISDVPLGAFLSGGVDSATIVALMAHEMTQPVKTFSIGFEEEEFNELPFARKVAERLGTDHHEMIVRPASFDLIDKIIYHFDEPFGDASALPTYYVSKLASNYVKVVLSGDGGDELFAGYDSYAAILDRSKYEKWPKPIRFGLQKIASLLPAGTYGKNFLHNISLPVNERFSDYVSHISTSKHSCLLSKDLRESMNSENCIFEKSFEAAARYDAVSRLQYVDMKNYLPGDILVKVDRMSMAHSIETRVPLLDQELIQYVNGLPSKYKLNGARRKYIFKKVAERLIPEETIRRRKQGFAVPLKYWFKDELKGFVKQILLESRTAQRGYFDMSYIKKLFVEHDTGRRDYSRILWHLLILELWQRRYLDT